MTKICKKCGEEKELGEFYKCSIDKNGYLNNKGGFRNYCKKCNIVSVKNWKKHNPKKVLINANNYYRNNKNKINNKSREKYKIPIIKKRILELNREWREKNSEKVKKYNIEWYKNNKEKIKINRRKYKSERRKNDINYRLRESVSGAIWLGLKKVLLKKTNKLTTWNIISYKPEDLKNHLEKYWEPWMSWNNWSNKSGYWTIDHTIPQSSFNFANLDGTLNLEEIRKCWDLSNLRPMEWDKNREKRNKII